MPSNLALILLAIGVTLALLPPALVVSALVFRWWSYLVFGPVSRARGDRRLGKRLVELAESNDVAGGRRW